MDQRFCPHITPGIRNPHQIYKPFLAVAGNDSTAWVNWTADPDGVVRRHSEELSVDGKAIATLSGQVARKMGVEPGAGLVDFWRGDHAPAPIGATDEALLRKFARTEAQ